MKTLSILFVDDDTDESFLFNEALEQAGLSIDLHKVQDGNQMFKYLSAREAPDLIFMDINMPYKDGMETLCELRSYAQWKTLPVVIYSTTRNLEHIEACYEGGATLFVVKPNDFEVMVQMVRKICSIDWQMHERFSRQDFVLREDC